MCHEGCVKRKEGFLPALPAWYQLQQNCRLHHSLSRLRTLHKKGAQFEDWASCPSHSPVLRTQVTCQLIQNYADTRRSNVCLATPQGDKMHQKFCPLPSKVSSTAAGSATKCSTPCCSITRCALARKLDKRVIHESETVNWRAHAAAPSQWHGIAPLQVAPFGPPTPHASESQRLLVLPAAVCERRWSLVRLLHHSSQSLKWLQVFQRCLLLLHQSDLLTLVVPWWQLPVLGWESNRSPRHRSQCRRKDLASLRSCLPWLPRLILVLMAPLDGPKCVARLSHAAPASASL